MTRQESWALIKVGGWNGKGVAGHFELRIVALSDGL